MSCPFCSGDYGGLGMSGQRRDPLQVPYLGSHFGLAGLGGIGYQAANAERSEQLLRQYMQGSIPKTKLQLAQEYAADARKRHPEMQVKKLTSPLQAEPTIL